MLLLRELNYIAQFVYQETQSTTIILTPLKHLFYVLFFGPSWGEPDWIIFKKT